MPANFFNCFSHRGFRLEEGGLELLRMIRLAKRRRAFSFEFVRVVPSGMADVERNRAASALRFHTLHPFAQNYPLIQSGSPMTFRLSVIPRRNSCGQLELFGG